MLPGGGRSGWPCSTGNSANASAAAKTSPPPRPGHWPAWTPTARPRWTPTAPGRRANTVATTLTTSRTCSTPTRSPGSTNWPCSPKTPWSRCRCCPGTRQHTAGWDPLQVEDFCARFADLSLLADYRLDPPGPRIRLHDITHHWLRDRTHDRGPAHTPPSWTPYDPSPPTPQHARRHRIHRLHQLGDTESVVRVVAAAHRRGSGRLRLAAPGPPPGRRLDAAVSSPPVCTPPSSSWSSGPQRTCRRRRRPAPVPPRPVSARLSRLIRQDAPGPGPPGPTRRPGRNPRLPPPPRTPPGRLPP